MQLDLDDYLDTADLTTVIKDAVSERMDVSLWPAEDQFGLTVRVIEEGMRTLFVLLMRATKGILALAEEKFPKERDEEADKDEDEEAVDNELEEVSVVHTLCNHYTIEKNVKADL